MYNKLNLKFIFIIIIMISSCSKNSVKQIIGTWETDINSTLLEIQKIDKMSDEEKKFVSDFLEKITISVTEDKYIYNYDGSLKNFAYKVKKEKGQLIVLELTNSNNNEIEFITFHIKKDKMWLTIPKLNIRAFFKRK